MSQVLIERHKPEYDFTDFMFGRWADHVRKIEKRAYHLFEKRGLTHGSDLDDWFQAEREINSDSTCEVDFTGKSVVIVLTAPGIRCGTAQSEST